MEGKERGFNERMPRHIQKYLIYNNVNLFVYAKPFRKTKQKNKENEFEVFHIPFPSSTPPPSLFNQLQSFASICLK